MQSSNNKRVTLRDPKASATAVLGLGDWSSDRQFGAIIFIIIIKIIIILLLL